MFYGQGAGAGATASAVVGDLIPIIAYNNAMPIVPGFNRTDYKANEAFESFVSRSYIAFPDGSCEAVKAVFGNVSCVKSEGEYAIVTEKMSECELNEKLAKLTVKPLSRIRFI